MPIFSMANMTWFALGRSSGSELWYALISTAVIQPANASLGPTASSLTDSRIRSQTLGSQGEGWLFGQAAAFELWANSAAMRRIVSSGHSSSCVKGRGLRALQSPGESSTPGARSS